MANLVITEEQVEWLPIARFIDKQLVDKFANYVGVQFYKQSTTIDGGKGKLLELTYRCKEYDNVGCAFKMFAKKAAATNSKVFLVYRSGTHICGHHFFSADETDDDEETDVEESEEESILEEESEEESILEEESEESTLEQDMANIVVEEPTDAEESDEGVVEIDDDGSGDENLDLDSDKTAEGSSANMDEAVAEKGQHMAMQHYVGNGPRAAINNFDNKDRGAALQKMIQDGLGLVFKGLMVGPAEVYFVSDAKNTGFASARTMLTLRLLQINSASAPMISMVEVRNGVRDSANGKFEWLIPDFDHFLWAVRGLCISAFFPPVCQPSNSQQSGEANTSSGKARRSNPQVHEPNGKPQKGSTSAPDSSAFSVLDVQHPKLRLEELAAEMGLSVQKHGGGRAQTRLIFELLDINTATTRTRLHVVDGDGHVTLVEFEMKPKAVSWKKKLGTQLVWTKVDPEYFRYALLGKAMDVFHPNHGKQ